ncbi:MAG TPA: AMP-binding protein [Galbitalea sp.]
MSSKTPGVVPYPQELVEHYRAEGVWGGRTISQELLATAERYPDNLALATTAARWTYRELVAHVDAIASGLLRAGLKPGDPVIMQVTNSAIGVAAWYGFLRAGLVPVCTLAIHRAAEIRPIATQTGAVAHLVQADAPKFDLVAFAVEMRADVPALATLLTIGATDDHPGHRIEDFDSVLPTASEIEYLDEIGRDTNLSAPAIFQLSGGTTGIPKVIPRLHEEYWYNGKSTATWWGLDETDRLAFALPLVHNAAIANSLFASHSIGAALVLGTPPADVLLPLMAREKATWVLASPGLMIDFQTHREFEAAFGAIKTLVISAARLDRPLFDELEARGLHVTQAFGMTEGMFLFTANDGSADLRAGSIGVPISPLDEVRLYEPDTEIEVAPGEPGELCVRGPYTIRGYFNAEERNAQAFTADGFYRSGDIAVYRQFADGRSYSLEGRVKDLINRGGEKINAEEIEVALMAHPSIMDVALVAMPDSRLGERACAFVVLASGVDGIELDELCQFLEQAGFAKFKWPERVEVIELLPRTQIGKIAKAVLRDQVAGGIAAPLVVPA